MLGRKRKAAAGGEDVNVAIRALLDAVLAWRDTCGRAYKVVHRVELSPVRAVLWLGKFERVTRGAMRALEDVLEEGGAYAVGGWDAVPEERALALSLIKRSAAADAAVKRLRRAGLDGAHGRAALPDSVPASDRPALEETAHRVLAALGEGGCSAWRLVELPAEYRLTFDLAARVPERALSACGTDASFVDFDAGALVAIVNKTTPDILY